METFVPRFDLQTADRMFEAFVKELTDKVAAIARDDDHDTKIMRAADLVASTPPSVTGIVLLAFQRTIDEYDERLREYESLMDRLGPLLLREGLSLHDVDPPDPPGEGSPPSRGNGGS